MKNTTRGDESLRVRASGKGADKSSGPQGPEHLREGTSRNKNGQKPEPGPEQEAQPDIRKENKLSAKARKPKMETEEGAKEVQVVVQARIGSCPVCKGRHFYQRKVPWGSLPWPSDRLTEFKIFQALSPTQKTEVIQGQEGCKVYGAWVHSREGCHQICQHIVGGPSLICLEKERAGVWG